MESGDVSSSSDTHSSEMDILYDFLIREAGPQKLVPNSGVKRSILSEYMREGCNHEDLYEPSDSVMGRLVLIFDKYFQLRVPLEDDFPADGHKGVLKYLLESMFTAYVDQADDFEIKHLWQLEKAANKFRNDAFGVAMNAQSIYGFDHNVTVSKAGDLKYATYFGEFLFFCSAKNRFSGKGISYIERILETANAEEKRILKELSLTPELGIATFLVYRNWVFDTFPKVKDSYEAVWKEIEAVKGLEPFHNSYCESVKKMKESKGLSCYLNKIVRFLRSKASPVHRIFNYNVLSSDEFLAGLTNKDYFIKLDTLDRYLLRLFSFLVDAVIFLKDTNEETLNYNEIPNFFKNCWPIKSDTPVTHVQVYLFEASQLLDFAFVENFKSDFLEEYVRIYKESNNVMGDNFFSLASTEPTIKMKSLFLFYGMEE